MQLNDFKSAWKHLKLVNSLEPVASKEIASIIESYETSSKWQRILLNAVLFIVISTFCQSG